VNRLHPAALNQLKEGALLDGLRQEDDWFDYSPEVSKPKPRRTSTQGRARSWVDDEFMEVDAPDL
jgi:hypothetical protein